MGIESVKGSKRFPLPAANNNAVVIRYSLKSMLVIRVLVQGLVSRLGEKPLISAGGGAEISLRVEFNFSRGVGSIDQNVIFVQCAPY